MSGLFCVSHFLTLDKILCAQNNAFILILFSKKQLIKVRISFSKMPGEL